MNLFIWHLRIALNKHRSIGLNGATEEKWVTGPNAIFERNLKFSLEYHCIANCDKSSEFQSEFSKHCE
jgi:hypothetical protein